MAGGVVVSLCVRIEEAEALGVVDCGAIYLFIYFF